jgi:hypothetical protein
MNEMLFQLSQCEYISLVFVGYFVCLIVIGRLLQRLFAICPSNHGFGIRFDDALQLDCVEVDEIYLTEQVHVTNEVLVDQVLHRD